MRVSDNRQLIKPDYHYSHAKHPASNLILKHSAFYVHFLHLFFLLFYLIESISFYVKPVFPLCLHCLDTFDIIITSKINYGGLILYEMSHYR